MSDVLPPARPSGRAADQLRDVRLETYDGAHEPDTAQIVDALNWFKELRAKRAAGARPPGPSLR